MAYFLSRDELYRILQRELPPDVYPDGNPTDYYSTADMYATADVAATGYANAARIYANYWPQTADERIADWEITAFGYNLDAALTLQQRRDRVSERLRSRKGLRISDMIDVVLSIIGTDKQVNIIEWGCSNGGWSIGVSHLGTETYLNGYPSRLSVTGPTICSAKPSDYGYTQAQWNQMRQEAYTYEVQISNYLITDAEFKLIDLDLSTFEPARSQHVINRNSFGTFDAGGPNDVPSFTIDGGGPNDTSTEFFDGGNAFGSM